MEPSANVQRNPMTLASQGPAKHVTDMNAYNKALAALTRSGLCEPPTPRPFMALHIPGAQKAQRPTTRIWKSVLRKTTGRLRGAAGLLLVEDELSGLSPSSSLPMAISPFAAAGDGDMLAANPSLKNRIVVAEIPLHRIVALLSTTYVLHSQHAKTFRSHTRQLSALKMTESEAKSEAKDLSPEAYCLLLPRLLARMRTSGERHSPRKNSSKQQ